MNKEERYLNTPKVKPVKYQKNFIKTAVCELRFPTLLELETEPPRAFQAKIRKTYPFYESRIVQQIGSQENFPNEYHYIFGSKDKNWTVTVKSSAIALETSKYVDFEDYFSRFTQILEFAKDMIDSDFFTRVGLRYINFIPLEDENLEGWIRPDLVLPLTSGVLGPTEKFASLIQGYLENGQYTLRQELRTNEKSYILDFDYFKESVELKDVKELIKTFHDTNFSFFSWCLGDKSKIALGDGKLK